MQQHAGQGNALALATGEAGPLFTNHRSVAIIHRHDEIVGAGQPGGMDHLMAVGIGVCRGNVGEDRALKQQTFLRHIANLAPKRMELNLFNVQAIDQHATGDRVIEARNQFEQGAFAAAALPHQAKETSSRNLQGDRRELGRTRAIAETHLLKGNVTAQLGHGDVIDFIILGFQGLIHNLGEMLHR